MAGPETTEQRYAYWSGVPRYPHWATLFGKVRASPGNRPQVPIVSAHSKDLFFLLALVRIPYYFLPA